MDIDIIKSLMDFGTAMINLATAILAFLAIKASRK